MASNDPPLSPSPSSEASTIPPPAQSPPNSSLGSITAMEEWREYATAESPTLGPEPNIIISHDGDDAIARHEYLLHLHHNHEHTHPINHDNNQELPTLHNESENGFDKQDSPRYTSKMTPRIRSISSPTIPQSYSLPSFPRKAKSCYAFEEACESHWDYGPSAIAEEEAALEYAAELAAAKAASKKRKRSSSVTSVAGGAEAEAEAETGTGVDWGAAFGEEEEEIEEEDDHCLSGVCLPKSQFFQTSVICSNTMTRDGLANERTLLAWLNTCNALCLVSFSFITRSVTLETVSEDIQDGHSLQHKDRLPKAIGWVCFLTAFFASIFSLAKYLRNIRRISTRYPFVRAGKWTLTIGMTLGVLIMTALVIANTTRL